MGKLQIRVCLHEGVPQIPPKRTLISGSFQLRGPAPDDSILDNHQPTQPIKSTYMYTVLTSLDFMPINPPHITHRDDGQTNEFIDAVTMAPSGVGEDSQADTWADVTLVGAFRAD